jgi:hypothetical protein
MAVPSTDALHLGDRNGKNGSLFLFLILNTG